MYIEMNTTQYNQKGQVVPIDQEISVHSEEAWISGASESHDS